MNGQDGAKSKVGAGSTFWFDLPSETAIVYGATLTEESEPQLDASTRQYKVLCIDDSPITLKLVALILSRRMDINLIGTPTPEIGIELALAHRPDLILLDINMPGMNGYQVLKELKKDERLRLIPVFAITAEAMPSDIEHGLASGFNAYIPKPFNVGHLLKTIDQFLGRNRITGI